MNRREGFLITSSQSRRASLLNQECQLRFSEAVIGLARKEADMLGWALTFFIIAIIAAFLGFGGIAAGAAEIAKIIFFLFLILFVIALLARALRGRPPL